MSDFNDNVVVLLILELSIRIYLTIIILNLPRLWSVYIVRLLSVSTARSSLLNAPTMRLIPPCPVSDDRSPTWPLGVASAPPVVTLSGPAVRTERRRREPSGGAIPAIDSATEELSFVLFRLSHAAWLSRMGID